MNKPLPPELFSRAEGLFKRAANAGGRAWARATEAPDEAARRRKIVMMLGAGIVAFVVLLAVLSRLGSERITMADVASTQAVTVTAVGIHSFAPVIALNGEARPVRDIQVAAPATGVRILELLVDEGDTVRRGQPMARLDTSLAQAQIRAAQASVAEAQSAAVRARGEYERAESIRDSGALSTEAIEQRRAAALAADARLAATRAQLQEVNTRLGGGYVRAPDSGLVIDRSAEIGRNVDGQVLYRIAAGNELEVAAQVSEAEALALERGQRATFTLVDGSTVQATLSRTPASIDSRTRTGEALFALPSGSRVRAGMYLRGQAHMEARESIALMQSSVLYDEGQAYVFVVDDTNVVHRRNVSLGARSGEMIEVVSGLDAGLRVVGSGAAFLRDGEEVRPLAPAGEARPAPEEEAAQPNELRGRKG